MKSEEIYTIKDIAKIAHCSQSTVSKALNDRHDISAKTKQKILDIVHRYNFVPSRVTKPKTNNMTENIGVIFCRETQPLSGNPFYSRILEGIEGELVINNYNLVLHLLQDQKTDALNKIFSERKVDGVIIMGIMTPGLINLLNKITVPVILVDPAREHRKFSKITIDNERGAYLATQYLIDKGHRKIAFISGDLKRSSFRLRYEGFKKAMNQNNIPIEKKFIRSGGMELGYEQVSSILKGKKCPTAIFSTNDTNALYAYKAILDHGLKIPDDISVVGFDDVAMAKFSSPPLTTVRVYKEEIGSVAVRELLWIIRDRPKTPTHILVPTRFVERESVRNILK